MLLIFISIIKRKPQNVNHKIRSDGIFCTIRPDANAPPAGAGRCRRARGRCLRAWGAVGAAFSSTGTSLADVESCWWAQVAVCTAFPAQGAYCERWALSARLSGSGNIVGGRGALFAGVGRCRRGFPGTGTSLADVGRCLRAWGRCLRAWGAVGGRGSPFAQLFQARGSAAPSCARPRPSAAPRAAPPLDIPPQRCYYNIALRGGMAVRGASDWVWRSLVACLNGVQEAGGSNPLTQTTTSEQSPLCSGVFFAFGRCICRKKAAVAPLPCSSFSAKGPARLACSLASALTTARCRYQPFAAAAPCGAGDGPRRAHRTRKSVPLG